MSIELPSNIAALISSLKAESAPLAKTSHETEKLPSLNKASSVLNNNKLLRIKLLTQINRLISELIYHNAETSRDGSLDKQTELKIIILQLRIELIKLEAKIINTENPS